MRTRAKNHDRWWAALLVAGAACLAVAGIAATASFADVESAARGSVTYRVYCRNCHGQSAHGDGPLAELLKVPTADLTKIAARNGGAFPADKVRQIVDGRAEVAAHGDREMPIWGDAFQRPEQGGDQEKAAQKKIADLVDFLESIQAPSAK